MRRLVENNAIEKKIKRLNIVSASNCESAATEISPLRFDSLPFCSTCWSLFCCYYTKKVTRKKANSYMSDCRLQHHVTLNWIYFCTVKNNSFRTIILTESFSKPYATRILSQFQAFSSKQAILNISHWLDVHLFTVSDWDFFSSMLWWAYICNSFTIALSVSLEGKNPVSSTTNHFRATT